MYVRYCFYISLFFHLFLFPAHSAFDITVTDRDLELHHNREWEQFKTRKTKFTHEEKKLLELGEVYQLLNAQKYDEAKKILLNLSYYNNFILKDYVLYFLAKIYYIEKRFTLSLKRLDQITQPPHYDFFLMKGNIDFELGNKQKALEDYKKYLAELPDLDPMLTEDSKEQVFAPQLRYALLIEKKAPSEAFEIFKKLHIAFPHEEPEFLRKKMYKTAATFLSKEELTKEFLYQKADFLKEQGQYEQSEKAYLDFLNHIEKDDPLVDKVFEDLYYIKRHVNDVAGQKKLIRLLHKVRPGNTENTEDKLIQLARFYWNQEEAEHALLVLNKIQANAKPIYLDEALIIKAQIYGQRRNYKKAIATLKDATMNSKDWEEKRIYLLAWYHYLDSQFGGAAETWGLLTSSEFKNSPAYLSSLYWQREALRKVKFEAGRNASSSDDLLEKIFQKDPFSYYSYLSFYETKKRTILKFEKSLNLKISESLFTQNNVDEKWVARSFALLKAYIHPLSAYALSQAFKNAKPTLPVDMFYLQAALFSLSREHLKCVTSLNKLLELEQQVPNFYLKLLYPRPYFDLAQKYASEYGVSPYLILSIMRQESGFNDRAKSGAHALGLMQLLPRVARDLASERNTGLGPENLYDPETNIRFGAQLISQLLKQYGDNLILMLASYNAGEPQIKKWRKKIIRVDTREFIEQIPYSETRNYIKLVLRNYHNYLQIYENKVLPPVYKLYISYKPEVNPPK